MAHTIPLLGASSIYNKVTGIGRRLVIAGDSFTAQNTGGSADTGSAYHRADGYMVRFLARMGWPYYFPAGMNPATNLPVAFNAGVGGDTATLLLARYNSDVLAKDPDTVSLMIGTNDVKGGGASTYATYTAAVETMLRRTVARGSEVWLHTIPPRNTDNAGSVDFTANERKIRSYCNSWIRDQFGRRGVKVIDHDQRWCEPGTGSARAGFTREGLHPSLTGTFNLADAMVEALGGSLPPPLIGLSNDPYNVYDATYNPVGNLLSNPDLSGTGGTASTGVTGDVADDWIAARSSGSTISAVASKITRNFGGNSIVGQRFVVTAPGGGASSEIIRFRNGASGTVGATRITTGVSSGQWLVPAFYRAISLNTTSPNLLAVYNEVIDASSNGRTSRGIYIGGTDTGYEPDVAMEDYVVCPPLKTTGTTGFFFDLDIRVDGTVANAITVDFFAPQIAQPITAPPITAY